MEVSDFVKRKIAARKAEEILLKAARGYAKAVEAANSNKDGPPLERRGL